MACPVCGERCTCSREGFTRAAILLDPEPHQDSAASDQGSLYSPEEIWRQEVASRVDAFCARRGRKRIPRPPSLNLDFEPSGGAGAVAPCTAPEPELPPEPQLEPSNIIEFPRIVPEPLPCLEPLPYIEELAEPIIETPRILDAEEQPTGLLFGGEGRPPITLPSNGDAELVHDESIPAGTVATLSRRIAAGVLDALLISIAAALFAFIFLHMAKIMPASRTALAGCMAVPVLLWAIYQYLFLVYAAATPGMRLTGMQLTAFDGGAAPRSIRRWRAFTMLFSAMALGLGFLWASIDEYGLCWHDRITRTLLRHT